MLLISGLRALYSMPQLEGESSPRSNNQIQSLFVKGFITFDISRALTKVENRTK